MDYLIPVLLFVAIAALIVWISLTRVQESIDRLREQGISQTNGMEISSDDIRKIVELVLDEIDKRHE